MTLSGGSRGGNWWRESFRRMKGFVKREASEAGRKADGVASRRIRGTMAVMSER